MGLYDFTTKEVLNKVFRTASGGTVSVNDGTTQERLNAVLDTTNNRLNVSLANTYWVFCHNFTDEINTDDIYLPWSDSSEGTSAGTKSYFIAPFDMTFVKLQHRQESIANPHNLNVIIGSRVEGNTTETTLGSQTKAIAGTDDHKAILYDSVSPTSTVSKGNMAYITIEADADPGGSTDHYITSIWSVDLTS